MFQHFFYCLAFTSCFLEACSLTCNNTWLILFLLLFFITSLVLNTNLMLPSHAFPPVCLSKLPLQSISSCLLILPFCFTKKDKESIFWIFVVFKKLFFFKVMHIGQSSLSSIIKGILGIILHENVLKKKHFQMSLTFNKKPQKY